MKKNINDIHKLTLKIVNAIANKTPLNGVTEEDVDQLAEAIELLNDVYEELYDHVFEN